MNLTEIITPAVEEKQHWHGVGIFDLEAGDTLKIESASVEHLEVEIPTGDTYRFRVEVHIEKL